MAHATEPKRTPHLFLRMEQAKSQIGRDFGGYQPSTYQIKVIWLIVRLTQTLQSV